MCSSAVQCRMGAVPVQTRDGSERQKPAAHRSHRLPAKPRLQMQPLGPQVEYSTAPIGSHVHSSAKPIEFY